MDTSAEIERIDSFFRYFPHFLDESTSIHLLNECKNTIEFHQYSIKIFGKEYLQPRKIAYMGNEGANYTYSGQTYTPIPFHPILRQLKTTLERFCNQAFDAVLINYYRDGKDAMGWHSDDEPELDPMAGIASLSLGVGRDFLVRKKKDKSIRKKFFLKPGSLLIMLPESQQIYEHSLPKRLKIQGERINLTFRTFKK